MICRYNSISILLKNILFYYFILILHTYLLRGSMFMLTLRISVFALDGREYRLNLLIRAEDRDFSQLHKGEYKRLFESVCKGDFQRLRNYVG